MSGQREVPEPLPAVRAVEVRRVVELPVAVPQGGQEEQRPEADPAPHVEGRERRQRELRGPEPVQGLPAHEPQADVERAEVRMDDE